MCIIEKKSNPLTAMVLDFICDAEDQHKRKRYLLNRKVR